MDVLENVPLSGYSTMKLGGPARYLTEINDRFKIAESLQWAEDRQLPVVMIGQGSNIVWGDSGYPGLVIVNKIMGFEIIRRDENDLYVSVGAGENWDEVVSRCVATGYSGIEELSLIPGTAGATPVQNVGAYGREIKDVLVRVEAFDKTQNQLVTLRNDDCAFEYRDSRFKSADKGRFFISSISLHLTKTTPAPPFYGALESYFAEHGITDFSPQTVRDAVIAIRSAKLPDPAVIPNNGSFFANPVISLEQFAQIHAEHENIPHWQVTENTIKLSAAWLVQQVGLKGYHDSETGMATWDKQPLVLVNEHAESTAALLKFKEKIVSAIKEKFQITLIQEPELINLKTVS